MSLFNTAFLDDHFWTAISASSALLILVSSVADRRRQKRKRIDDVGFMPWTGITVLSVLATVVTAAFAIKAG
ncbi:MAG: hypothetical protein ABI668_02250 [Sphingorhabdus sp.]